jgi:putative ABC transport system permease protein
MMELLWRDLCSSARSLSRARLTTSLALGLMTLTVSLSLAVFSFFDRALLSPLPYPAADRLVVVAESHPQRGAGGPLRPANFLDWKSRNRCFERATSAWSFDAELKRPDGVDLVPVQLVLEDFFDVLGVAPLLGRTFLREDHRSSGRGRINGSEAGGAAVVSDGFWKTRLGFDPDVLGKSVELDGVPFLVVGVMPPSFRGFGSDTDVWIPWALSPDERANRSTHVFFGLARLAPGVELEGARAEMRALYRDLEREYPGEDRGWTAQITPYRDVILGDTKRALVLAQTAALVVLLVGCIDVAALLTARSLEREWETRVRRALGATPWRLLRQSVLESSLLSLASGLMAIAAAAGAVRWVSPIDLPTGLPFPIEPGLGGAVPGVAFGVSLGAGLVLGLVSHLGAGPLGALGGSRGSRKRGRALSLVIVFQIALAMAVLSVGGLLLKGLVSLEGRDLGFDPEGVVSIRVHRPRKYDDERQQGEFQRRLLDEVRSLPGVESAAVALYAPLAPVRMNLRFDIQGRAAESTDTFNAEAVVVSETYFHTLGAKLVEGRGFGNEDLPGSPGAIVVNETLAREYWPNEDPLGTRVHFPYPDLDPGPYTVVGIVEDIAQERLTTEPPRTVYLSQSQSGAFDDDIYLLLRTSVASPPSVRALRARISALDPDIVMREATPMPLAAARSLNDPRRRTLLLGGLGIVALFLAASGLYGLLSFSIARRRREIGIRMAMGAGTKEVVGLLAGRGVALALAGAGGGLGVAWIGARSMGSLLYGVSSRDPFAYGIAAAVLLTTTFVATYVPARRASRTDPWSSLRQE